MNWLNISLPWWTWVIKTGHGVDTHWLSSKEKVLGSVVSKEGNIGSFLGYEIAFQYQRVGEGATLFHGLLDFTLENVPFGWVLSKEASILMVWVFGMIRPVIEPRRGLIFLGSAVDIFSHPSQPGRSNKRSSIWIVYSLNYTLFENYHQHQEDFKYLNGYKVRVEFNIILKL